MTFTAEEKRKAVEREIGFRKRVYPRWVDAGKMTHGQSLQQIAVFEAIREDYVALEKTERLL